MTQQADFAGPFGGYHPLFLPEDGQSPEDFKVEPIRMISIYREENGRRLKMPRDFSAAELTSPNEIFSMYGGGTYIAVARREDGSIYSKRKYDFAGPPISTQTTAPAPGQSPPPAAGPLGGLGADPSIALLTIFLNIMQSNAKEGRDALMAMMQMIAQANAQTTQILIAAMGQGAQGSAGMANMMQAIVTQAMAAKTAGPGEMINAAGGLFDLAKKIAPAGGGAGEYGQIAEMLGGFVGGLAQARAAAEAAQQKQPPQTVTVTATPVQDAPPAPVPPPNGAIQG